MATEDLYPNGGSLGINLGYYSDPAALSGVSDYDAAPNGTSTATTSSVSADPNNTGTVALNVAGLPMDNQDSGYAQAIQQAQEDAAPNGSTLPSPENVGSAGGASLPEFQAPDINLGVPKSTTPSLAAPTHYSPYTDENAEFAHDVIAQNLEDPQKTLSDAGAVQTFQEIEGSKDQYAKATLQGKTLVGDTALADAGEDVTVDPSDFEASQIDLDDLAKTFDKISEQDPMKAASMSEHLEGLIGELENGTVPAWARPAVTKVEQMLASRGLSASSVGRDALFNAIISSAMPLAQQDSMYEQEANKINHQNRIQGILNDAAAHNAGLQFNAASQQQRDQFMTQLATQVDMQNATRKATISQFNAGQENTLTQFKANLDAQRTQFNAQMSNVVEQSNVQWRREMNKINTAGINAVNQANAQNAFNLNNQASSLLWQEMRDEATNRFKADQSQRDRMAQLEATVLANEALAGGEIGTFLKNVSDGLQIFDTISDKLFDA